MPTSVPANRIDTTAVEGSTIMLTNATKRANIKHPTQKPTPTSSTTSQKALIQTVTLV